MVIDKIGNINNIIESKKIKSVQKKNDITKPSDSIQISSEGLRAAEEARYTQMVKETPDVRMERIQEIKAQMEDGSYDKHLDEKVLSMVADKILDNFLK